MRSISDGGMFSNAFVPVVEELIVRANRMIDEQVLQPCTDTGPQKAQVKQLRIKIERLVKKVAETDDDRLSTAYHQQILQYQKEHNSLLATIREEEARQRLSARPIDIDAAKAYLTNLRETLDQDIPIAAEAIRALTGSIRVRQEQLPDRKRSRWIACVTWASRSRWWWPRPQCRRRTRPKR